MVYLIKEEYFADTWDGCKQFLGCSIKSPMIELKALTSFLAITDWMITSRAKLSLARSIVGIDLFSYELHREFSK